MNRLYEIFKTPSGLSIGKALLNHTIFSPSQTGETVPLKEHFISSLRTHLTCSTPYRETQQHYTTQHLLHSLQGQFLSRITVYQKINWYTLIRDTSSEYCTLLHTLQNSPQQHHTTQNMFHTIQRELSQQPYITPHLLYTLQGCLPSSTQPAPHLKEELPQQHYIPRIL